MLSVRRAAGRRRASLADDSWIGRVRPIAISQLPYRAAFRGRAALYYASSRLRRISHVCTIPHAEVDSETVFIKKGNQEALRGWAVEMRDALLRSGPPLESGPGNASVAKIFRSTI